MIISYPKENFPWETQFILISLKGNKNLMGIFIRDRYLNFEGFKDHLMSFSLTNPPIINIHELCSIPKLKSIVLNILPLHTTIMLIWIHIWILEKFVIKYWLPPSAPSLKIVMLYCKMTKITVKLKIARTFWSKLEISRWVKNQGCLWSKSTCLLAFINSCMASLKASLNAICRMCFDGLLVNQQSRTRNWSQLQG